MYVDDLLIGADSIEDLQQKVHLHWHRIEYDLQNINNIETPRFVNSSPQHSGQIHGFSDVSEFLGQSKGTDENNTIFILASKL